MRFSPSSAAFRFLSGASFSASHSSAINNLFNRGSPLARFLCFLMHIAKYLGVDPFALQEQSLCLLKLTLSYKRASNIVFAVAHGWVDLP